MHRHDEDRIAALAEGHLPAEEAAAFEAEVASCPTCTEILSDFRLAIDALSGLPEPRLTDLERAGLHRQVRRHITLTKRPRWVRLVPAFAAAAALVAVFGVASMLQNQGGETFQPIGARLEQADTTATAAAPTTTAAASMGAPAAPEMATDQAMPAITQDELPEFVATLRAQEKSVDRNDVSCLSLVEGRSLIAAESVLLGGRPVEILVIDEEALVVDPTSCDVLISVRP